MLRSKIIICAIALIIMSGISANAQKKCMFIGAPEGAENAEYDKYILPLLKDWGYEVDRHISTELPNYTESEYAPYDFIFLSETVNSAEMPPLQSIPKPMLCSDGWGAKESSLAFGAGEPVGILEPAQPVVFLEESNGHELAAGYEPGTVIELGTVMTRKDPCLIVWAKPTIPYIPIAGVEADPSRIVVYGIEKGTTNAVGIKLKNRVAVVGVHAWGYNAITEEGAKVFKAGIEWVMKGN